MDEMEKCIIEKNAVIAEKDILISDLEREISSLKALCICRESEISEFKSKCSELEEGLAAAKSNKGIFGLGKR